MGLEFLTNSSIANRFARGLSFYEALLLSQYLVVVRLKKNTDGYVTQGAIEAD